MLTKESVGILCFAGRTLAIEDHEVDGGDLLEAGRELAQRQGARARKMSFSVVLDGPEIHGREPSPLVELKLYVLDGKAEHISPAVIGADARRDRADRDRED